MSEQDKVWELDRDFVHEESGLCVRINILRLYRPLYSMEIGRIIPKGFVRHLQLNRLDDVDVPGVMSELLLTATSYTSEQSEKRSQEIASIEQARAQREQDKRKRHEQNVQVRRDENRKRAHGGKGGGK